MQKCNCGCRDNYTVSKVLKAKKPEWQNSIPTSDPELRNTYLIAAKNAPQFKRAFIASNKGLITPEIARDIKKVWVDGGTVNDVMAVIPFYQKTGLNSARVWRKYTERLIEAYGKTVYQTGRYEMRNIREGFGVKTKFTKANKINVIPINQQSVKWIEERALALLVQVITPAQKKVIRAALKESFAQGLRAETVIGLIRKNVGLTNRDYKATINRRNLLLSQGLPPADIARRVDKYRDQLIGRRAVTIARTETIAAQAHGRNAAWQAAEDSGDLPPVERMWVKAAELDCDICDDLDGKTAPLGGTYDSSELGAVYSPPAHSNCRCTEIMRKK